TIDDYLEEMIQIRRHLHQYPELSFQEKETSKYIRTFYDHLDIPYQSNIGGGYGLVASIEGEKPGRTIGLRADFDALPIHEQTDLPFQSKTPGVMHACGHDGHTATLLVLAKVLESYKHELP